MKNPKWSRDELILALNLYFKYRTHFPPKNHSDILLLSEQLNQLNKHINKDISFRNPNGVYMKLNNFKSFDPDYTDSGKVGLWRTSQADEAVWNDYSQAKEELKLIATAIIDNIEKTTNYDVLNANSDYTSAKEGKLLCRVHILRERNSKLVKQKKDRALQKYGKLQCEVCGFVFSDKYGRHGEGVIEAHHINPLHTLTSETKTTLNDLSLLCANCHRIIHSSSPWLTINELKQAIKR